MNLTPPAITGTAQVGNTLTASNGTWSNSPTSSSYQWARYSGDCTRSPAPPAIPTRSLRATSAPRSASPSPPPTAAARPQPPPATAAVTAATTTTTTTTTTPTTDHDPYDHYDPYDPRPLRPPLRPPRRPHAELVDVLHAGLEEQRQVPRRERLLDGKRREHPAVELHRRRQPAVALVAMGDGSYQVSASRAASASTSPSVAPRRRERAAVELLGRQEPALEARLHRRRLQRARRTEQRQMP